MGWLIEILADRGLKVQIEVLACDLTVGFKVGFSTATSRLKDNGAYARGLPMSVSTTGTCWIDVLWRCGWVVDSGAFDLGVVKYEVLAFDLTVEFEHLMTGE